MAQEKLIEKQWAEQRLQTALEMIGYEDSDLRSHRSYMVSSIMLYARSKRDVELANACEKALEFIKAG